MGRKRANRQSLSLALLIAMAGWAFGLSRHAALAQGHSGALHPPGEYVTVNGARLWVESEGHGVPVILIAGGPGLAHDVFHPFFSSLAGRCRLIYYDGFGRGKSARADRPARYTFSRDVEDLDGIRKALGLAKVSLFGHSYGGLVALAYAFEHPEAVGKVAVANSMFSGRMWQESDDDVNRRIREQLPEVWAKVQGLRAQGLRSSSAAHQEAYRLPPGFYWHRRPAGPTQLNAHLDADVYYAILGEDADFVIGGEVAGLDFETRLKELREPLLVLAGRYDNVCPPSHALAIAKSAPRASVVLLEESGHYTFVEENEKTMKLLGDFFANPARSADDHPPLPPAPPAPLGSRRPRRVGPS
jgi:proline iminopeptidase